MPDEVKDHACGVTAKRRVERVLEIAGHPKNHSIKRSMAWCRWGSRREGFLAARTRGAPHLTSPHVAALMGRGILAESATGFQGFHVQAKVIEDGLGVGAGGVAQVA